jgi:pyruvate/2-oxoacid:ferredoxin oxidoreductase alpha subunit
MEMRKRQQEAFDQVLETYQLIDADWDRRFGRSWSAIESYRTEDADTVLVTSGTITSTARYVINERRERGEKVGLLKIKMFRPFPSAALRRALAGIPKLAVLDRNISPGHGGIFAEELRSALYDLPADRRPRIDGYVLGLGGRDVTPDVIGECLDATRGNDGASSSREDIWVGVKP